MRIEVAGIPAPQGSKRHVGGGRMVEQSRAVGPWREAVRAETQRAVANYPDVDEGSGWAFTVPVAVHIWFWLPRPASAAKSVKYPAKRPDIDKLARSVLDGLVAGGAIPDDGLVTTLIARKRFAGSFPVGCTIDIKDDAS